MSATQSHALVIDRHASPAHLRRHPPVAIPSSVFQSNLLHRGLGLPSPLPPALALANDGSNPLGSLPPVGTSARHSIRLALTPFADRCARKRRLATASATPASSLDLLQGTFEKIHFQRLLR